MADGGYTPTEREKQECQWEGGAEKDGRRKTSRGRELEKYNLLDREGARAAQARTGRTIQSENDSEKEEKREAMERDRLVRSRRGGEKGIGEKRTGRDSVRRGTREREGRRRPEPASTPT